MYDFGMLITPGTGAAGPPKNGSPSSVEPSPLVGTTNQEVQVPHLILKLSWGLSLAPLPRCVFPLGRW